MAVMAVCGLLLVAGLAAGVMWSGRTFCAPAVDAELSAVEVARLFVWYASLMLVAGVGTGVCVIGAGGRLAMRLLAVTAGDEAQGRITEAEEVVGKITVDGTIGFVLFNGIFFGVAAAALYLVVRRFLPSGQLGGVVFGLALLVVLGTTVDPLRNENPDFDIIGPGWLAVLVFTGLAVAYGVVLAAVAARLSAWLPLPSAERRVLLRYILPAAVAVFVFLLIPVLVVVGLAVVAATRWRWLVNAVRSPRMALVGRVIAVGVVLVALPNAVISVADIASQ
jgi:hypothetical protein